MEHTATSIKNHYLHIKNILDKVASSEIQEAYKERVEHLQNDVDNLICNIQDVTDKMYLLSLQLNTDLSNKK